MATGPSYRVSFRRRREGKTDYQMRKALVTSRKPRLVVRGTLRHLSAQIVKAETTGDRVIAAAHSRELAKTYGWKGNCGNLPAAYLTGLLCGYRVVTKGLEEAVLDLGLQAPSKGARVFATLKGVLDAGVLISHDKEKLPTEERLSGQHIADYTKVLSGNPDVYKKRFSENLSKGLNPEQLPRHFSSVKEKIVSSFEREKPPEVEEKKPPVERKRVRKTGAKPRRARKKQREGET